MYSDNATVNIYKNNFFRIILSLFLVCGKYILCIGASVSLPIEPKKYMKILVEQAMLQFFVAVKVRESKQLFLKVRRTEEDTHL